MDVGPGGTETSVNINSHVHPYTYTLTQAYIQKKKYVLNHIYDNIAFLLCTKTAFVFSFLEANGMTHLPDGSACKDEHKGSRQQIKERLTLGDKQPFKPLSRLIPTEVRKTNSWTLWRRVYSMSLKG